MHGAEDVKLIQADISKIDKARFPTSISACLLDVDLAVPIYDGLTLIWPRLETGGVIVVERHKATPRVSYAFANVSAARMARSITVNVGLALPEDGKTEAPATLRLGMR
jgi:hypothetical protein